MSLEASYQGTHLDSTHVKLSLMRGVGARRAFLRSVVLKLSGIWDHNLGDH